MHVQYHPFFVKLAEAGGFSDVLLVGLDGDVIYSVRKDADFATNLMSGPWAGTALARAYRNAMEADGGTVIYEDYAPYAARDGAAVSFFATKVISRVGSAIGVIVIQTQPELLGAVMKKGQDLEGQLDASLIGADGRLRSSTLLADGMTDLPDPPQSDALQQVLAGQSYDYGIELGSNGVEYLVSMRPLSYFGLTWALKARVPLEAAVAPVAELRQSLLVLITVFAAAAALLGFGLSRFLTQPILLLQHRVAAMRENDLETEVPSQARQDEIGHLACDLEDLRVKLRQAAELEEAEHKKAEDQKRVVDALSDAISHLERGELTVRIEEVFPQQYEILRTGLNNAVSQQAEAISTLLGTASTIDTTAVQIEQSMDTVRRQAEKQAAQLEESSSALKDLTGLVSNTADNTVSASDGMQRTIKLATKNEDVANNAKEAMTEISASASKVLDVTSLIDTIAFQTNLLALNASVEAARAGSAGRGFSVVASEVRALAERTASAASEINDILDQNAQVISEGTKMVGDVSAFFEVMNRELEDASQSLKAIAEATQEQSESIRQIDNTVSWLDQVTQENVTMMAEVHQSGVAMAGEAAHLRETADMFTTSPEAAADEVWNDAADPPRQREA